MGFPKSFARLERDYINPLVLRLAGHGPYANLEHVGRRTGTVRRTPLRGFVQDDVLYLGLNHGTQADWCRNVEDAGRCRVQYRGQWYACAAPRVVPFTTVSDRFPQPERTLMARLLKTTNVLTLPLDSTPPQTRPWRYALAAALGIAATTALRRHRHSRRSSSPTKSHTTCTPEGEWLTVTS
jgi:deazaflavin-dependent oxidoreductase (nitroreductase family)